MTVASNAASVPHASPGPSCGPELGPPVRCTLWIDEPGDGAWNMACDEALLEAAASTNAATLRLYRWARPTLSLGYFQAFDERHAHAPSRDIDVVRRLSGGGALVHDAEITYALCLPAEHPLARRHQCAYAAVHDALLAVLARHGIVAQLAEAGADAPTDEAADADASEPFLCFQRRCAQDVVAPPDLGGAKWCGSAQRRRRGALLQHGSLLLRRSSAAPELPGIADAASAAPPLEALQRTWAEAIAERCALDLVVGEPHQRAPLDAAAAELAATKYRSPAWTQRR
jgi:lipoate-protein ligase A